MLKRSLADRQQVAEASSRSTITEGRRQAHTAHLGKFVDFVEDDGSAFEAVNENVRNEVELLVVLFITSIHAKTIEHCINTQIPICYLLSGTPPSGRFLHRRAHNIQKFKGGRVGFCAYLANA